MVSLNRTRLLTSTLLLTGAVFVAPAQAQDTAQAEAPEETIVVTGTLIQRPDLQISSPVTVVGAEEIGFKQPNTAPVSSSVDVSRRVRVSETIDEHPLSRRFSAFVAMRGMEPAQHAHCIIRSSGCSQWCCARAKQFAPHRDKIVTPGTNIM